MEADASVRFVDWERRLVLSAMVEADVPNTESTHAEVLTFRLIPVGTNDVAFKYAIRVVRELEMRTVCVEDHWVRAKSSVRTKKCDSYGVVAMIKRPRIAGRHNLLSQQRRGSIRALDGSSHFPSCVRDASDSTLEFQGLRSSHDGLSQWDLGHVPGSRHFKTLEVQLCAFLTLTQLRLSSCFLLLPGSEQDLCGVHTHGRVEVSRRYAACMLHLLLSDARMWLR